MSKPNYVDLGFGPTRIQIPILYEDRSALAIDKPSGWLLIPFSWQDTARNLQAAITSSIAAGHFWARSRNLKFLQYVHRLDGDTSGVLLFAKSPGAVESLSKLFETRAMSKTYLAVVEGKPIQAEWTRNDPLGKADVEYTKMRIDPRNGKEAETSFKVLDTIDRGGRKFSLVECKPVTGRTHQIRVHLMVSGHRIVGDRIYNGVPAENLALRSVFLGYRDPFLKKDVFIRAPREDFLHEFGFKTPRAKQEGAGEEVVEESPAKKFARKEVPPAGLPLRGFPARRVPEAYVKKKSTRPKKVEGAEENPS